MGQTRISAVRMGAPDMDPGALICRLTPEMRGVLAGDLMGPEALRIFADLQAVDPARRIHHQAVYLVAIIALQPQVTAATVVIVPEVPMI